MSAGGLNTAVCGQSAVMEGEQYKKNSEMLSFCICAVESVVSVSEDKNNKQYVKNVQIKKIRPKRYNVCG